MRRADRFLLTALVTMMTALSAHAAGSCPALLDRSIPGLLEGKPRSLCEFSGRVLMVVNTSSRC